jgi:hypothetical protein
VSVKRFEKVPTRALPLPEEEPFDFDRDIVENIFPDFYA